MYRNNAFTKYKHKGMVIFMTTKKGSKPKHTKKKAKPVGDSKRFEIIAIGIIALCIYLVISIYSNAGGPIGEVLKKFFTGLGGICAYIVPFVTAALIIYSMRHRKEKSSVSKYVMSYVAVFVLCGIFQIIFQGVQETSLWYSNCAAGEPGGGFIGGLVVAILSVFGTAGTYIILFSGIIVLSILIFDISIANVYTACKNFIEEFMAKGDEDKKEQTKKPRGVATMPDIDKSVIDEKEIVFNIPEETTGEQLVFADPEIRLYDDVTSGPEDQEPSDEEKEAKKISEDEKEKIDKEIKEEMEENESTKDRYIEYTYPSLDLLARPSGAQSGVNAAEELKNNARQLIETLHSFKVDAKVVEISQGPTITRYEIEPAEGVRVNQITNLSKDIGLKFRADKGVMVAPVPGKSTIGIEIENKNPSTVTLREVIESEEFKNHKSKLAVALGKDVSGKPIIMDLAKMPHLLIAGATGAGKSVCINTLIISLLYKADPNEVKLVMIDPKQVELGVYNGIPHLLIPVVKDAKKATGALSWAVQEMTERYSIFERNNVRNIKGYNDLMDKNGTPEAKMASIVIIIDEFADLMMVAPADVENYVCRIAQLARAAGMHLVIATQRPVVKFITGNIKANVPSRISFMVASAKDSMTILDMGGAEKLIGKGDMLYMPVGETTPSRMQCAFVSDDDVKGVVEAISSTSEPVYDPNVIEQIEKDEGEYQPDGEDPGDADELLPDAIDMAITSGQISTSLLQRRFRIGYNRAGSIIDQMEARGIISGLDGNKPRQVLITREQYNEMLMK